MLGVRKIKEQEKLRKESLENILGSDVLSLMENKGIIPSFAGKVRICKKGSTEHIICKDACIVGFGEKRPLTILTTKESQFSLLQLCT